MDTGAVGHYDHPWTGRRPILGHLYFDHKFIKNCHRCESTRSLPRDIATVLNLEYVYPQKGEALAADFTRVIQVGVRPHRALRAVPTLQVILKTWSSRTLPKNMSMFSILHALKQHVRKVPKSRNRPEHPFSLSYKCLFQIHEFSGSVLFCGPQSVFAGRNARCSVCGQTNTSTSNSPPPSPQKDNTK